MDEASKEALKLLGSAVSCLALGDRKWAINKVREALEVLEDVCSNCGRPWEGDKQ